MINKWACGIFSTLILTSCGGSSSDGGAGADIPLIKPLVLEVTPSGFFDTTLASLKKLNLFTPFALDSDEIKSRFFSAGPTEINELLNSIDSRLEEINTRSAESTHDCLSNASVPEDLSIFGQTVTGEFQCYDTFGTEGGMIFGKSDDAWYIYQNGGQQRSFAKVVAGTDGNYTVDAWLSVGQGNADDAGTCSSDWFGCSYGVIQLQADTSTGSYEMTTAGTGFGYCGAHIKSDGTNVYISGSAGGLNMAGDTWNCAATDTLCATSTDLAVAGSCASIDTDNFALTTLGVTGESTLGTGITLNGTDSDSTRFGRDLADISGLTGTTDF